MKLCNLAPDIFSGGFHLGVPQNFGIFLGVGLKENLIEMSIFGEFVKFNLFSLE